MYSLSQLYEIVMMNTVCLQSGKDSKVSMLAAMVHRFHYLKYALALVLIFIGSKIFIADMLGLAKIPALVSLGVTFGLLAAGVLWSLWKTRGEPVDKKEARAAIS